MRVLASTCAVVLVAVAGFVVFSHSHRTPRAVLTLGCKHTREGGEAEREREREAGARGGEERDRTPVADYFSGPDDDPGCETGGIEGFGDLMKANSSRYSRDTAPGTQIRPGAYRAAARAAADMPTVGGDWHPYGNPPLIADIEGYSSAEGFKDIAGRATAFTRSPSGSIYVATPAGGVWESTDTGKSWHPIGDNLPTQVTSSVAWSDANGGTLLVLTGDNAYGGGTLAGLGVYRTTDNGATWQHASGVPDGALGFKIVVDPNDPNKVYAATGAGLFRSTDGGASFVNVNLPTGKDVTPPTPDCTGKAPSVKDCFLANMVTDVVVQGPANANTPDAKPGAVMAAVGWRAGQKANADGAMQSPNNGTYTSPNGEPGSFTKMDMVGGQQPQAGDPITQARLGRIALGIAAGADQNHNLVYAIIQDATKFNSGVTGLDASEPKTGAPQAEYLNGVWVTPDFGKTWKELEGSTAIDNDPSSNSVFAPPVCRSPTPYTNYCPGSQAWYNLWIAPDPTRTTSAGAPDRLVFGLEEIWSNDPGATPPGGLDGSGPAKFKVIGRYAAGDTCVWPFGIAPPVCPIAEGGDLTQSTTHPDQHGGMFVPDGSGGVTLFAANDGGVYAQHTDKDTDFSQRNWGRGNNAGLATLQPYDAEMAKDGTVYMGLQDNAEAIIKPDGKMINTFSGDGVFTAVDPDHSNVAYEEVPGGVVNATTDGGQNWNNIDPALTSAPFVTQFQMDPNDANHLIIAGRDVKEKTDGPTPNWTKVFDLGTQKKPGDASAGGNPAADDGPDNQNSAIDVLSQPIKANSPTGPKTKDFSYDASGAEFPGGQSPEDLLSGTVDVFAPGTYEDHPFTIGKDEGDAAIHATMTWDDPESDWDLYVYAIDKDGNEKRVGASHDSQGSIAGSGAPPREATTVQDPQPGDYVIRVVNFSATGPLSAPHVDVKFDQRTESRPTAVEKYESSAAYVGFCGYCDTITQGTPFQNGVATNVSGNKPGQPLKADGWHIAKAKGLPNRIITSIRIDPAEPRTVYVTLGGYGRQWAYPGAVGDDTSKIGVGHVFKSTDAGESFFDISGDLPDMPATWSVIHSGHLVVGTERGVFESCDLSGGAYSRLGKGLPNVPISTLRLKPGDPDTIVAATFGRGVYTYHFDDDNVKCPPPPASQVLAAQHASTKACTAQRAFASTTVKPRGRGLRLSTARQNPPIRYSAFVFRQAAGGRVLPPRPAALFAGKRGTITWNGKPTIRGRKVTDGYYFVRFGLKLGALADVDRVALLRKHGRWHVLRDFDYHSACRIVRQFKLSGPTFGGTRKRPLGISFRLALPAGSTAKVVVTRGKKTVAHSTIKKPGTTLHKIKLPARRFSKGGYRVTLSAKIGARTQKITLVTRKV